MSNVLIYSGPGVSTSCSQHTLKTLRQLLPTYDVHFINANSVAIDPWQHFTSLFVLPGGRDLPYIEELERVVQLPNNRAQSTSSSSTWTSTTAAEQIRRYVTRGGKFIGICAGAYYSSAACEFEKGVEGLEVVGQRAALQFFSGTCKGTVYPGFTYDNQIGSRIVKLIQTTSFRNTSGDDNQDESPIWWTHYNGGGAFLNAEEHQNVEVLARYPEDDRELSSNNDRFDYSCQPAIISCKVGEQKGKAVLFGTHPEFPLDFKSRPIQLLRDGKSSLPFFQSQKSEADEQTDKDLSHLSQEQKWQLEGMEIERLREFGKILKNELGLVVSMPQAKDRTAKQQALSSTATPSQKTPVATTATEQRQSASSQDGDQVKLTPLYLVSQNQVKVDRILIDLRQVLASKTKATQEISHLEKLSSSASSEDQDLDKIRSSHLFSFQDVNDTFHFYSANSPAFSAQNSTKESGTDSILSALCCSSDYSPFRVPLPQEQKAQAEEKDAGFTVDLQRVPKYILTYPSSSQTSSLDRIPKLPHPALTPHFNLNEYFSFLNESRERLKSIDFSFRVQNDWFGGLKTLDLKRDGPEEGLRIGDPLIYSQVVTSTQTMLDK